MSDSTASETTAIDTLRALAISGVLAHHVFAYSGLSVPYLDRNGGLLGVQLFFVISGYLIVQSAQKYSIGVFALHRFFRIFPPYLVALLICASAYYILVPSYRKAWDDFAPYFLLNIMNLQFLHPVSVLMLDPLHVGWSLTVELFWYVLAPLAVWCCGKGSKAKARWLTLLILSVLIACLWVFMASRGLLNGMYEGMFASAGVSFSDSMRHGMVDNAPLAQLMFFFMGASVYIFRTELGRIPSSFLWVLSVSVLLFVPNWNVALQLFPNPLTGLGIVAFFLWIVRSSYGDVLTRWLAKVSYSMYLIHVPILLVVFKHAHWKGLDGLLLAIFFIAVGSELGWRCVEHPFQKIGKKLSEHLRPDGRDRSMAQTG